jgi:hypothetical protein
VEECSIGCSPIGVSEMHQAHLHVSFQFKSTDFSRLISFNVCMPHTLSKLGLPNRPTHRYQGPLPMTGYSPSRAWRR